MSKSKVIKMSLSSKSINEAIEELEKYKRELITKCELFTRRLAQEGVSIARENIDFFDAIDSGALKASIQLKKGDVVSKDLVTFYVYTDCPYAKYVEFGTGIVGALSPHPKLMPNDYDLNHHGHSGWWYFKDGELYWTKGQPAKPFMHNASIDLITKVHNIAKEVFGE